MCLDKLTLIQVDLPIERSTTEFEPPEIALTVRVHVRPERVIIADGAQQFCPGLEVAEQADVSNQLLDAAGHHDTIVAGVDEVLPKAVVELRGGRGTIQRWGRAGFLIGHDGRSCASRNPADRGLSAADRHAGTQQNSRTRRVETQRRSPAPGLRGSATRQERDTVINPPLRRRQAPDFPLPDWDCWTRDAGSRDRAIDVRRAPYSLAKLGEDCRRPARAQHPCPQPMPAVRRAEAPTALLCGKDRHPYGQRPGLGHGASA